jgi:uncharacterized protein
MAKRIRLMIGGNEFEAELNDTDTANSLYLALPFEAYTNLWGEEIYFETPVKAKLENGRTVMEPGELAFWPKGSALCIFYGPTPASKGGKPEAISEVTPLGRIIGDPRSLEVVGDRMKVIIEQA